MSDTLKKIDIDKTCRGCLSQKIETFKSIFDTPGLLFKYTTCTSLKIELGDDLPPNLCCQCINQCYAWSKFKSNCKQTEAILQRVKNKIKPPISPRISEFGPPKDPLSIEQPKVSGKINVVFIRKKPDGSNNEEIVTINNSQEKNITNTIQKSIDIIKKDPLSVEEKIVTTKSSVFRNVSTINKSYSTEINKSLVKIVENNTKPIGQVIGTPKPYLDLKNVVIVRPGNGTNEKDAKFSETQLKTINYNMRSIIGQRVRLVPVVKSDSSLLSKPISMEKRDTTEIIAKIDKPPINTSTPTVAKSEEIHDNILSEIFLEQNTSKDDDIELNDWENELRPNIDDLVKLDQRDQPLPFVYKHPRRRVEKVFNCEKCDKTFNSVKLRRHHMILQHEPKRFKCKKCGKLFAMRNYLTNHYRRHLGIKPHKCEICNKRFSHKPHLRVHILRRHTDECPYLCSYCGKSYKTQSELTVHIRSHTGERPYSCEFCDWKFSCAKYLIYHKHRLHSVGNKSTNQILTKTKNSFTCAICEKTVSSKSSLKSHLLIHTNEKPFECHICYKSFATKVRLKTHLPIHSEGTPFQCEICLKKFKLKVLLAIHLKTHRTDRPYSCIDCDKTYKTSDSLAVHRKIHTRKNLRPCTICGHEFLRNSQLKIHMRTHTGEKPFSCTMCDRKFASIFNCRLHILTHTGEKPFSCTLCDKSFKINSMLTKHKQKDHAKCQEN